MPAGGRACRRGRDAGGRRGVPGRHIPGASVEEVALAGEEHRHPGVAGGVDDLLIAHGSARLDDRRDARVDEHLGPVGEGEERVGCGDRRFALLYAESTDGVSWVKPNLNLVEFEGSTENNIVGGVNGTTGTSVSRTTS